MSAVKMDFLKIKQKVIREISSTLDSVEEADKLVDLIVSSEKIFVVGSGRTKLMLEAFAKRLRHLGLNVHVVEETVQPPAFKKDLLIVASGLGKSVFPLSIAKKAKEIGMKITLITSKKESEFSKISDLVIHIPASVKSDSPVEKKSFQPLNNLFEQCLLIFCDITAILVQNRKGLQNKDLLREHANLE